MSTTQDADREHVGPAARVLRGIVVAPIVVYRYVISPALGPRCRYEPSCSSYAEEAIRTRGVLRGIVLATWRLLRCNPWSRGGFDPVSAQRVFGRRDRRSHRGGATTMGGGS